ncbi:AMSH-like ubiquitin thioesterase 1 [Capsicum annuum]|uniref:AMSH-like ubiquitin thioesterase 1 n=1 Tax=Capsicum annuum TaxID=4072 RepID=A0A1U8G579_CAPAN|nr:AMSH-like ubiquitin thioesterase 1 [Capsicum annuum]KAF3628025.1 AMSH-like ubiquitin thioesterase 1 [Capsicum annuum]PHT88680.1 AMSH-like ubiquitin thioesterase 1 [Capsicum annuum]
MMTRSSSGQINIAASTKKLDVDNRISLKIYYRIADNILKQADIFRLEGDVIDLYVMLLRFSSLVSETIPCHRDYRASLQSNKIYLKKKLLNAVAELEELKPIVQQKLEQLNRKSTYHVNKGNNHHQNNLLGFSGEYSPANKQSFKAWGTNKIAATVREFGSQVPTTAQFLLVKPVDEHIRHLSLSIPRPKDETLNRHSILGPNGLRGQLQIPASDRGVSYPSNVDFTPVLMPSLLQPLENDTSDKKDDISSECVKPCLESTPPVDSAKPVLRLEEPASLISFDAEESPLQSEIIRQPSPPPVLAEVQDLMPTAACPADELECGLVKSSPDGLIYSEDPLQLHISASVMDTFMKLAKSNTNKNLETCGVLAGSLKNRRFYVTALIIPKQESTSDSCQTTNEEEIFEVQDKQALFPLGWIHTHPTQSCFMSSIDVHTQYSYQIMLPEAIAIVMAPRDSSRKHGIFRLTNPGGMAVIRQCPRRGFHPHDPPSDGSPIYKHCTDVYMDPNLKFDVIDLR